MPRGDFANETDFRHAVEALLAGMLVDLDQLETDELDPALTPGNLTLRFDSGATFILSQQTPTHELWLSANLRAWHFVREDGTWVERDSGEDMLGLLGRLVGEKLRLPVKFQA